MRLQEYIGKQYSMENWEELRAILEKDCQPFIKELRGAKTLLVRGMKAIPGTATFQKKSIRTDRVPRFISQNLTDMMSAYSKKKWGWDIRKEGLFCTNDEDIAGNFGRPYIVFPVGRYYSVWIDDTNELYEAYDNWDGIVNELLYRQRLAKMPFKSIRDVKNRPRIEKEIEVDEPKAQKDAFEYWIKPSLDKYEKNKMGLYLKKERQYSEIIVKAKEYYQIDHYWYTTLLGWFSDKYWKKK